MLFDSGGQALRLFLPLGQGQLMSGERLRLRLGHEWGIQWEQPFDGLLLVGGTGLRASLVWGPCRSQTQGLRSLYTHSFSTTGDLLL